MLTLEKLKSILDKEFGEPFLPLYHVKTHLTDRNTLRIWIGRRDIEIDENGEVVGAGTRLA